MALRPIGTEFWYEFPLSSNDQSWQHRFLYRIVAHSQTTVGQAETLEVIREQMRPMIGVKSVKLSDRAVWDYVFGEWQEREL